MDYAITYTLTSPDMKHVIFEARITDVPESESLVGIRKKLFDSHVAAQFSDHGIFLANRQVQAESKAKGISDQEPGEVIPWSVLEGTKSTQVNLRVPGRERSAWELAASRAGVDFRTWVRRTLAGAAGIEDPTQKQG